MTTHTTHHTAASKLPPLSLIEGLADARKLPAELLLALADIDRRTAQRRTAPRADSPGRRAIERMSATPAEIDRLARRLAAEHRASADAADAADAA